MLKGLSIIRKVSVRKKVIHFFNKSSHGSMV